jgi:hypothetical protein
MVAALQEFGLWSTNPAMEQTLTAGQPGAVRGERDRLLANRALVRGWLYLILLMLFALVLVGGATRLTDSGLSITEWKPIHGVDPAAHTRRNGRRSSSSTARSRSISRSTRA